MRHAWRATLAGLAAAGLLAACAPDPEPGANTASTTALSTTVPPTGATADPGETDTGGPRVADDCPPEEDLTQVPSAWSEVLSATVAIEGESQPIEIDLVSQIDATCFMLASTYAAAFDIAIPQFGRVSTDTGATLVYEPIGPPANLDDPDQPWWGEDRIRVCATLTGGRQGCTNIDIRVLRSDVVALQDQFAVTTRPQLTTPPQRSGGDNEVTGGGVARLQDAFAAEWALQLVAQTLDLPAAPQALAAACEATGTPYDDLVAAGERLLDQHADLLDTSSVAITTTMGTEPEPDLSARANAAVAGVAAWVACDI